MFEWIQAQLDEFGMATGTLNGTFLAVWGGLLAVMIVLAIVSGVKFKKQKRLRYFSMMLVACGGGAFAISVLAEHISAAVF